MEHRTWFAHAWTFLEGKHITSLSPMHLKILGYCQIPNENFNSHLSNLHQIIDLVIPVIINSLLRQPNVRHLFFIYLTKIYNVPIILESIKLHGPALKLLAQTKEKQKQTTSTKFWSSQIHQFSKSKQIVNIAYLNMSFHLRSPSSSFSFMKDLDCH